MWGESKLGEALGKCEYCGSRYKTRYERSRTAYHWDGKGEDPNRPVLLCRECAAEHHDHWDGMWDEYHAGLL